MQEGSRSTPPVLVNTEPTSVHADVRVEYFVPTGFPLHQSGIFGLCVQYVEILDSVCVGSEMNSLRLSIRRSSPNQGTSDVFTG